MAYSSYPTRALRLAASALGALILVATSPAIAQSQANDPAAAVKQIDTDCLAIQNAVMALHPIHVLLASGTWKVVSDGDVAIADRTHAAVTIADVYKQGKQFAWVHAHSYDQQGNQRATQLCFRQKDGTLQRARQATTVPDLNSASAAQAFFGPDGTPIQASAAFEMNDPMLAKQVSALPFYKSLPS
ncbi:MAG TPA: hypothetical protein VMA36_11610 [Candidatus Limnocylindria bacterium]|nr:hypothetical protein [Candidatus Limnocylindria bacterium]